MSITVLLALESALEHADIAMYQAKQCGRNVVRCFDSTMQQDKPTQYDA